MTLQIDQNNIMDKCPMIMTVLADFRLAGNRLRAKRE